MRVSRACLSCISISFRQLPQIYSQPCDKRRILQQTSAKVLIVVEHQTNIWVESCKCFFKKATRWTEDRSYEQVLVSSADRLSQTDLWADRSGQSCTVQYSGSDWSNISTSGRSESDTQWWFVEGTGTLMATVYSVIIRSLLTPHSLYFVFSLGLILFSRTG